MAIDLKLKEKLNKFLSKVTNKEEDYYSRLAIQDFENLKTALKDINNIITYRTTNTLMEWLRINLKLDNNEYKNAIEKVVNTKPNDNGYDIQIDGSIKIIAEVKSNKPINQGRVFGSAQKNGLIKDLESLLYGKSKGKGINYNEYLKFFVIFDFGKEVRQAVNHLLKNLKSELREKVCIFNIDEETHNLVRNHFGSIPFKTGGIDITKELIEATLKILNTEPTKAIPQNSRNATRANTPEGLDKSIKDVLNFDLRTANIISDILQYVGVVQVIDVINPTTGRKVKGTSLLPEWQW